MKSSLPFILEYSLHAFASDGTKMWIVEYGLGSEVLGTDARREVSERARRIKAALPISAV